MSANGNRNTVQLLLDRKVARADEKTSTRVEMIGSGGHPSLPTPATTGDVSALMLAARGGHADVVTLLLDRGVRVNDRDWRERSALDYAREAGRDEIAQLLKSRGARDSAR